MRKTIVLVILLAAIALSIFAIVLPAELFIIERTFLAAGRFVGFAFRFLLIGIIVVLALIFAWYIYQVYEREKERRTRKKYV